MAERRVSVRLNELDAAAGVGMQRNSLRNARSAFNALFAILSILESGLLPPEPLSPLRTYDRCGRPMAVLPPRLAAINATLDAPGWFASVWQAIAVAGGLGLPEDPSPRDLLQHECWDRIKELQGSSIGILEKIFCKYKGYVRRALLAQS
ncbi:MAG: hypothetical protein Q4G49_12205 [Paracoccus sp. (in: a-proteobacteria)]|nr:hypothetical protein [Paracoccus sp. (in: a-proteobacteria)]